MSELLPCPFCGNPCLVMEKGETLCVTCPDPHCPGHNVVWWHDDEGLKRWNTRYLDTCEVDDVAYDDGFYEYWLTCGDMCLTTGAPPTYCPDCGKLVVRRE